MKQNYRSIYYITGRLITLPVDLLHYRLIITLPVDYYITGRIITLPVDYYVTGCNIRVHMSSGVRACFILYFVCAHVYENAWASAVHMCFNHFTILHHWIYLSNVLHLLIYIN